MQLVLYQNIACYSGFFSGQANMFTCLVKNTLRIIPKLFSSTLVNRVTLSVQM